MIVSVTYVVSKLACVQVGVFECVCLCTVVVTQDFLDLLEIGILGEGAVLIGKCQFTRDGMPMKGI